MSDIIDRAKEMPSSLNDACRTIETMADEIASLRTQLEIKTKTAEMAEEQVSSIVETLKRWRDDNERLRAEVADLTKANELLHAIVSNREEEISGLRAQLAAFKTAAIDFIAKVDRGEARSKRSYDAFKAALSLSDE